MSKTGLILNLILLIIELIVQIWSIFEIKSRMLKLYTQHSNITAMLSAFIYVIFYFKRWEANRVLDIARFMSTSMLVLTFFMVVAVMAPIDSKALGIKESYRRHVFDRRMPILHVVCPILSLISYVFFEEYPVIASWYIIFPVIVTVIYIFVLGLLNILGKVDGPYTILKVKQQPVFMTIVFAISVPVAAALISYFIYLLKL